ncbi:putative methyltransferase mtfA [Mycobacterium intracellulare]|nr:putative methyltransferase mtfA [Mycobacterium intracellulare]
MVAIDTRTVDRTGLHRIWKAILIGIACIVFAACYFRPVLLIGVALILLSLVCARVVYKGRDRYIPNLYARDIEVYDDAYRSFIGRTLAELRQCKIGGHTLLWEASRLAPPSADHPDELLLDLGVWAGWSTRLISDASGRTVYGFDTFSGLVEDWPIDDHTVIKRGAFSLADPVARRFLRDTGVSLHDGVPDALGRKVEFIRGSTYETLARFWPSDRALPSGFFTWIWIRMRVACTRWKPARTDSSRDRSLSLTNTWSPTAKCWHFTNSRASTSCNGTTALGASKRGR